MSRNFASENNQFKPAPIRKVIYIENGGGQKDSEQLAILAGRLAKANKVIRMLRSKMEVSEKDLKLKLNDLKERENYLLVREQEIHWQAMHDELTGLLNRRGFTEAVSDILLEKRLSAGTLIMLNIDDFNLVNDVQGYLAGDCFLCEFAARLESVFGNDTIIARHGGDEFIIFCIGKNPIDEVKRLTWQLRGNYIVANNQAFSVQLSAGIARYPVDGTSLEQLMQKADVALRHAKRNGKNECLSYEESMQRTIQRRHQIRTGLKNALANQELYLVYQPIYGLNGTGIMGFEALLRWKSCLLGQVSPGEFIPCAEESGAIITIGEWVINEACRFACQMKDIIGSYASVSVNVSVKQLFSANFVDTVMRIVKTSGLPPGYLNLEVTESILMTNIQVCVQQLQQLRDFGIQISLDDFGTGYSSMTYLQTLPISALKIDKAFVDAIVGPNCGQTVLLIETIIQMAHCLGHKVIAEGVETKEQFAILQELKCDFCQGFLLSKPLAEESVINLPELACLRRK